MKKYSLPLFGLFSIFFFLLSAVKAYAFCPVCTVAVAAGVGLSRWLGVDDTISGLWVGAVAVAAIGWTISWLNSKNIHFIGRNFLTAAVYYALILIPFYKTDIIAFHPSNMLWGFDKLLLGIVIGSLLILLGHVGYLLVKERNDGHAHFPFERIVFELAPLIIMSGVFYFITRK